MEFKLKPYSKNLYPKGAVLVQDPSPKIWLQEIQKMGLNLDSVFVYPVPSKVANELYGCLIVFKRAIKVAEIGKNRFLQNVKNKLFIPENTLVFPSISTVEWQTIFSENLYVFHTDFGFVELSEQADWLEIIGDFEEKFPKIISPSKLISIPNQITSLRVEMDEAEVLKKLENPVLDGETLENPPFNMEKLLKGNQKELDKYLLFLEKNPEMALKYAVPLDILNIQRGNKFAKFSFKRNNSGLFRNLFRLSKKPNSSNSTGSGGGIFSNFGNAPSGSGSFLSDNRYWIGKIIFLLLVLGKFSTLSGSGKFFKGLIVILFFGGILFALFYFLNKFLTQWEIKPVNEPSHNSNLYQSGTGSKKATIFKYLPAVMTVTIITTTVFFVKFLTSDRVDTSVSPFFYILAHLFFTLILAFLIVKLFDYLSGFSFGYQSGGGFESSGGGNMALLDSDRFSALRNRYEKMADDFVAKKMYEKAAHVHMKLLTNHQKGAQVLEEGKLYKEAAVVYVKYCNNKVKGAECFQNGKVYKEAIGIYKEINETEKVGDLYLLMNDKSEADRQFYQVVDNYKQNSQYVKASLILRNKVNDSSQAQEMLLDGWRSQKDASNCLNNYFANVTDLQKLKTEIKNIYANETNESNQESFLQVLKTEYKKEESLEEVSKEIAYEIIANKIETHPEISSALVHFNKKNRNISKDIMKYKLNIRKRN